MIIKPEELSVREVYQWMIGCIMPRPIAFVSTVSAQGVLNLAPFSYFNGVTSKPPTVCFAPARTRDGGKKDTLINIEQTGEFVVNTVHEDLLEPMKRTAETFEPEVDEFSVAGLTPAPSQRVKVPRVAEALISMECRLYRIVPIGAAEAGAGFLVIGEVLLIHVADRILSQGQIDPAKLRPVGRLNGKKYTKLGEVI